MKNDSATNLAEQLFNEGMKFDWNQDKSPAAATLARANFQQSATMGYPKAIRALAHMTFEGRGGFKDQEHALLMLWSAFIKGDHESLDELSDMLESYAEESELSQMRKDAAAVADHVKEIDNRVSRVHDFMRELMLNRSNRTTSN